MFKRRGTQVKVWDVPKVARWLVKVNPGFSIYQKAFKWRSVDGQMLVLLASLSTAAATNILRDELGVTVELHQIRILQAVRDEIEARGRGDTSGTPSRERASSTSSRSGTGLQQQQQQQQRSSFAAAISTAAAIEEAAAAAAAGKHKQPADGTRSPSYSSAESSSDGEEAEPTRNLSAALPTAPPARVPRVSSYVVGKTSAKYSKVIQAMNMLKAVDGVRKIMSVLVASVLTVVQDASAANNVHVSLFTIRGTNADTKLVCTKSTRGRVINFTVRVNDDEDVFGRPGGLFYRALNGDTVLHHQNSSSSSRQRSRSISSRQRGRSISSNTGGVASSQSPHHGDNLFKEDIFGPVKSAIVFPLPHGSAKFRAVVVVTSQEASLTETDEVMLTSLSATAGIVLSKAKLLHRLSHEQKKTDAFLQVLKASESIEDVGTFVNSIAGVVKRMLQCERVALFFVDHIRQDLFVMDSHGFSIPMDVGIAGAVALSGQGENISDVYDDKRFNKSFDQKMGMRTRSMLCLPIHNEEKNCVIACFQAINKLDPAFDPSSMSRNSLSSEALSSMQKMLGERQKEQQQQCSQGSFIRKRVEEHSAEGEEDNAKNSTATAEESKNRTPALLSGGASTGGDSNANEWSTNSNSSSALAAEMYIPFTAEDQNLLLAFCLQISSVLRKHHTSVLVSRTDYSEDGDMQSIVSSFGHQKRASVPNNRRPVSRGHSFKESSPGRSRIDLSGEKRRHSMFNDPEEVNSSIVKRVSFETVTPADISSLRTLDFSVWDYSLPQLVLLGVEMIEHFDLSTHFSLEKNKLGPFLAAALGAYRPVPYHSMFHGFQVCQFAFYSLLQTGTSPIAKGGLLSHLDVLGVLLAAVCHDIDHPGNNNNFEISTHSELALRYNDKSVLENHHSFATFQLLRDKDLNFLHDSSLSDSHHKQLRGRMVDAILHTDMVHHFEMCKQLDGLELRKDENGTQTFGLDPTGDKDRSTFVNLLVHAADLSGQVLPLELAKQWERRVAQEFASQNQHEAAHHLPTQAFMENLHDDTTRAKNHLGFLDFVMSPLWSGMGRLFPSLKGCMVNLQNNRQYFAAVNTGQLKMEPFQQLSKDPKMFGGQDFKSRFLSAGNGNSLATPTSPSTITASAFSRFSAPNALVAGPLLKTQSSPEGLDRLKLPTSPNNKRRTKKKLHARTSSSPPS